MDSNNSFVVRIATSDDYKYAIEIIDEMAYSAAKRGAKIARRTPEYVINKINEGHAVIAVNPNNGEWAGFCCIEVWQHERYIANSGLIVSPKYRGVGVAKEIKLKVFELGRTKFPFAKHFSLTTNQAVMHVNVALGYKVVSYTDMLTDKFFLIGANTWVNYIELMCSEQGPAPYVAMVFDPEVEKLEVVITGIAQYLLEKSKVSATI